MLTVDQAVKIAVANNRMLKITSLQLGDTKEELPRVQDAPLSVVQDLHFRFGAAVADQF